MEAQLGSRRVQLLSEGLAAAGDPIVSYDGQRVFFAGKATPPGNGRFIRKIWRAGVLKC